jgi:hypothetical protein
MIILFYTRMRSYFMFFVEYNSNCRQWTNNYIQWKVAACFAFDWFTTSFLVWTRVKININIRTVYIGYDKYDHAILKTALKMVSRSQCEKPLTSIDLFLAFRPSEIRWDQTGSSIHFQLFCSFFSDARSTVHSRGEAMERKTRSTGMRVLHNVMPNSLLTATLKPYLVGRSTHSPYIKASCPYQ